MTIKSKSEEALMEAFVEAALSHQTAEPNAKGNKQAKAASAKMRTIYQELLKRPNGIQVFLSLLHHPDARVRVWAGPFGLTHYPQHFEPMVEEIARGLPSRTCLQAQGLLEAWRNGQALV